MPRTSERRWILQEIDNLLEYMILADDDESEEFEDIIELRAFIESKRFLTSKTAIPKNTTMNDMLWIWPDDAFNQEVRMGKLAFIRLVNLLKEHEVFKSNSRNKQKPVWIQLLVVLRRLGGNGNGNSVGRSSRLAGIGAGTVQLFTNRVFTAILSLEKQVVTWPNAEERIRISGRFDRKYGLKGCVGIIDGTPIVFSQRPHIDGETYWSRKCHYAMNVQLICDDNGLIRFHLVGWPGSCFDTTVFERSYLYRNAHNFFSDNEFIISDAGYGLEWFLCSPHRNPAAQLEHNMLFNYLFSQARCKIEHVNGVLKSRFMSLKCLPTQIKGRSDLIFVCRWVTCCIILYNLLIMFDDEWDDEDTDDEDDDHDPVNENQLRLITIRDRVQTSSSSTSN